MSVRELANGRAAPVTVAHWQRIGLLFAAAVTAWVLLGLWAGLRGLGEKQESVSSSQ
jgi:hypothetical protein